MTVFVTDDKWLRERGKLDPTDEQILKETQGPLKMMTIEQALATMRETEPEKFRKFTRQMEKKVAKSLTFEELVELGRQGNERRKEIELFCAARLTLEQAKEIRMRRVDDHYTWRAIARAAFRNIKEGLWSKWDKVATPWWPPSNQIAGMVLCGLAAKMLGENGREEPWN